MSMMTEEERKKEKKRIRDRNYRFNKLSPEKKRVRIAKDVIEQLDAGQLRARVSGYLALSGDKGSLARMTLNKFYYGRVLGGEYAQKVTDADLELAGHGLHEFLDGPCTVCGIGACFVAGIRRLDNFTLGEMDDPVGGQHGVNNDVPMRRYLGQWFSQQQLGLIEAAFEQSVSLSVKAGLRSQDVWDAVNWGKKYGKRMQGDDDNVRLRAIMQNIIDNDGEFKP